MPSPVDAPVSAPVYAERLTVPLRWWVQATMALAALFLAVAVAMPFTAALVTTAIFGVLVYGGLLWWGSARLVVTEQRFHAGRAVIDRHLLGPVVPLDRETTRRVAGPDADARAYLVLRPWLHRAVRVALNDPADPTPYWLVSTRRPERLAAALTGLPTPGHPDDPHADRIDG